MAYDSKPADTARDRLIGRRPWYLFGAVALLFSAWLQSPLLVLAALVVLVLGALADVWYVFSLAGLTVRRELSAHRAELGDELTLELTVENRKVLPLPRLEIEDELPEEGVELRGGYIVATASPQRQLLLNTLSLWVLQRVIRRYRVRCLTRGLYTFGPLYVSSGDPFGLLTRRRRLAAPERLLVYPLVVPIERLGLPARALIGERPAPKRLLEDPLRTAGVREYQQGDEPRRIHWKATARTGALQSKVYEPTTHHTLAVFVDLLFYEDVVRGFHPALLELALCAAASVAAWGMEQGFAVGLYANGSLPQDDDAVVPGGAASGGFGDDDGVTDVGTLTRADRAPYLRIAPSAYGDQLRRVEEALAQLVPSGATTIAEVLASEAARLPFGSTVVYIGTGVRLDDEGFAALRRLRSHGHPIALAISGDAPLEAEPLPLFRLGNGETWLRLWGEALAHAPSGSGEREPLHAVWYWRSLDERAPA